METQHRIEPEPVEGKRVVVERRPADVHSIGRYVADLSQETVTLVQQEMDLVRAEMNEKITQVKKGAIETGAGGAIAYAGLLLLLGAAVAALWLVLPLWASALIVGGITAIVGLIMLAVGGNNLKSERLTPDRTVESLRDTTHALRRKIR